MDDPPNLELPMSPLATLLLLSACATEPLDPETARIHDPAVDADRADAVFLGTVERVQNRMSDPDADGDSLPFTYVTWRVERGIKGVADGETFTTPFLGGRFPDGRLLVGSDQPNFRVGERDVMFVMENGHYGCPLVRGADSRIRLVDGRAYDEDGFGRGVPAGPAGTARSPPPPGGPGSWLRRSGCPR